MTKEQVQELAGALSILSAKSSIVKEREELRTLMEDNIASEEARPVCHRRLVLPLTPSFPLPRAGVQAAPRGAGQDRHVPLETHP